MIPLRALSTRELSHATSIAPHPRVSSFINPLSTFRRAAYSSVKDSGPVKRSARKEEQTSGNPELPSFSFKDLGATKTVRYVVIVAIAIGATIESIFWVKVGWRWLYPAQEDITESESAS
ncbi:hypothetical protein M501DRAFT_994067 [Patellaria atrata CBS 101060]|uniref:Uncharacterized protein n=1 Tax=Patellaria atrata CBS 101060 TaxID=1346257 RepID=A0A9P4SHT9_9PEZI|nr:hypothetical protein M501DRAFT_994067 [Patellaria atrata CBS 101060]